MELILENYKSFDGTRQYPIKPITIITGENSTGKTAFIQGLVAAYRTISRHRGGEFDSHFLPFDEIASYKGGRFGRASTFGFGIAKKVSSGTSFIKIECTEDNGVSKVSKIQMKFSDGEIVADYSQKTMLIEFDGKRTDVDLKRTLKGDDLPNSIRIDPFRVLLISSNSKFDWVKIDRRLRMLRTELARNTLTEFAPIRAKPQKYYDGIDVEFDQFGTKAAYSVKNFFETARGDAEKRATISKLQQFGRRSGLFEDINPKKLGRSSGDPFQIQIGMNGPLSNLPNVGYGVNQALPIVAHIFFDAIDNERIVIQQPEVHLHPRAQAELGSLFAETITTKSLNYVIETHSDYLIDRIKLAVAKKQISKNDVAILYFTKKSGSTHVDIIEFDEQGQIENPPESYRDFFLKEQFSILGIEE